MTNREVMYYFPFYLKERVLDKFTSRTLGYFTVVGITKEQLTVSVKNPTASVKIMVICNQLLFPGPSAASRAPQLPEPTRDHRNEVTA